MVTVMVSDCYGDCDGVRLFMVIVMVSDCYGDCDGIRLLWLL